MTATATAAAQLRKKLFDVATEQYRLPNEEVLVSYGRPGINVPDDMVIIGGVRSVFTPGAMESVRQREETIEVDMQWWFFRPGEEDAEQEATDALYARMGELENHIRLEDPNLGGLVREIVLREHQFDTTEAASRDTGAGRLAVATSTWEAKVRIRNH